MKIYFYKKCGVFEAYKKSETFCTLRGSMVNMEPKCFQSSDMCISRMRKSLMPFYSVKSVTVLTIERTTPISCIAAHYFLAIFLVTSFATAAGFKGSYDCLIYNGMGIANRFAYSAARCSGVIRYCGLTW